MANASGGWKGRASELGNRAARAFGRIGRRAPTTTSATVRVRTGNGPVTVLPPRRGLFASMRQVAQRATSMFRLEVELARAEIKEKTRLIGIGAGLGVGAMFFAFFGLFFLFLTLAAVLATFLPVWASLLIVTLLLLALCATSALLARSFVQRGAPPVPSAAIREAKLTSEALER